MILFLFFYYWTMMRNVKILIYYYIVVVYIIIELQSNRSEKNSLLRNFWQYSLTRTSFSFIFLYFQKTVFIQYKCCYGTIVTSVFILKIFNGIPYVIYFHSQILDSSFFSPFPKSVSNFATFKLLEQFAKEKKRKKTFRAKIASVPILV